MILNGARILTRPPAALGKGSFYHAQEDFAGRRATHSFPRSGGRRHSSPHPNTRSAIVQRPRECPARRTIEITSADVKRRSRAIAPSGARTRDARAEHVSVETSIGTFIGKLALPPPSHATRVGRECVVCFKRTPSDVERSSETAGVQLRRPKLPPKLPGLDVGGAGRGGSRPRGLRGRELATRPLKGISARFAVDEGPPASGDR